MAQHSDDAPKQPRRSGVLPPFVAPRTPQGTSSTREREATRRRSSYPFTAPDVTARTQSPAVPTGDASASEPQSPWTRQPDAVAAPEGVPQSSDRELVVEPVEPAPISLRVTGEQPAVEGAPIQVFEYGESESGLHVHTAEPEHASAERLELEPTEFSLDSSSGGTELQVESFWAAEPFVSLHEESPAGGDFASAEAGVEPSREEPSQGDLAERGAPAGEWHESNAEDTPEALDVAAHVAAAFAPELDAAPEPELVERSEQAHVSDCVPDAEHARHELDARSQHAAAEPPETSEGTSPWSEAPISAAAQVTETPSGPLCEVEPSALPPSEPAEINPQEAIAASLERVAHRIRTGEVVLVPDAPPTSDEAALAAVLAALLRAPQG